MSSTIHILSEAYPKGYRPPTSALIGRTGRMTRQIPAEARERVIRAEGGVRVDGTTCWDDPGFREFVDRACPQVAVPYDGKIMVSGLVRQSGGLGRNRFGKVSFRKTYK